MDTLEGSCFQNTFENKRLEHWSYRQERNLIDEEKLSGETHSRVQKPCASKPWSGRYIYIYIYIYMYIYIYIYAKNKFL
jgi:hypothetical protein